MQLGSWLVFNLGYGRFREEIRYRASLKRLERSRRCTFQRGAIAYGSRHRENVVQFFLVLHQLVPSVKLLLTGIAIVLRPLGMDPHVRDQVVLVREEAQADFALIHRGFAALGAQVTRQAGLPHVETAAIGALVAGFTSWASHRLAH